MQESNESEANPLTRTTYTKILNKSNCLIRTVNVPQQKNGSDCGVCVLENIERIVFNRRYLNHFKKEREFEGRGKGFAN